MAAPKFDFPMPGKKGEPKEAPKAKPESESDEDGAQSKADLGKMLLAAIKTDDGEAAFEAVKKILSSDE